MASTVAGHAVYAACQWGMISVLARLGSPEIVGQYALGVAVSTPILILAPVRRPTAGAADIRVMALVFALLGIAAVGFLEHSTQDRMALLLVAMAQSVEWIADIYASERSAISRSLHGELSVLALAIIVTATGHTGAGLLGVLIVRLLALFFYDFRQPVPPHPPQTLRPVDERDSRLVSFAANVPCYFIGHMLGYHSLGIFAAIASLASAADGIVSTFGQAITPQLAKLYREGDQPGFSRLSGRVAGFGLILGLCTVAASIAAGPLVLGLLFGPEYATHSTLLLALSAAAAGGFIVSILNCILTAGRRFHEQLPLEIAGVAATSLACVALVPKVGIPGAAFAAGFGFLIRITGQLWILRCVLRHPRQPVLLALLKEPLVS